VKIPFIGQAYENRSIKISNQKCINLYPEIQEAADTRAIVALQSVSGCKMFSEISSVSGEVRGLHFSENQRKLFAVVDQYLYSVSIDKSFYKIGRIDGDGLVSMTDRGDAREEFGNQICIATGVSYWVYDKTGLSKEYSAGAVSDLTFQDGYILLTRTGTDRIYCTETPKNARVINPLDFIIAGANTDLCVGITQVERRVWVFGADSITILYNSGATEFPFSVVDGGSSNGFGLAGKDAKVMKDSNVFWCSTDGRIYVSNGYTPTRISHYGIENSIRQYEKTSDCEASAWTENGHKFIAFSFPSGNETWVYDANTRMWHQRSSGYTGDVWSSRLNVRAWELNLVGDRYRGFIGELDLDIFQEYGAYMQARRVTPTIHANQNVFITDRIELVMDVGLSESPGEAKISMRWSDDSGYTWGNWIDDGLGEQGHYKRKVTFYELGQAKDRVYELMITDNVRRTLIDCVVEGEVGYV